MSLLCHCVLPRFQKLRQCQECCDHLGIFLAVSAITETAQLADVQRLEGIGVVKQRQQMSQNWHQQLCIGQFELQQQIHIIEDAILFVKLQEVQNRFVQITNKLGVKHGINY